MKYKLPWPLYFLYEPTHLITSLFLSPHSSPPHSLPYPPSLSYFLMHYSISLSSPLLTLLSSFSCILLQRSHTPPTPAWLVHLFFILLYCPSSSSYSLTFKSLHFLHLTLHHSHSSFSYSYSYTLILTLLHLTHTPSNYNHSYFSQCF